MRKHATNEGAAISRFAVENHVLGEGIDTDYASGELVRYVTARKGDVILAMLKSGVAVQQGDKLGSNANGELDIVDLTAATTVAGAFVGEAFENKASSASAQYLKVEIA